MAKAGKKRIAGVKREPNGRKSRSASATRDDTMQPALTRRGGNTDQLAGDALGQFTLKHRLRRELYDGAMTYWKIRNTWRQAVESPSAVFVGREYLGEGIGPNKAQIAGWLRQFTECEAVMRAASGCGFAWIDAMLEREVSTPPAELVEHVVAALIANARHLGMIGRFHPFVGAVDNSEPIRRRA